MRVKITERGASGPKGFVFERGKTYDLAGLTALPAYLVGKCIIVGDTPEKPVSVKDGKTPITNPEPSGERKARLKELSEALDNEHFTKSGKPDVTVINTLLNDGETPFTAEERDQLWEA